MTFKNIHNWPLEHWHIETCSKCSLKCPRCSRQEVPQGLVNTDLSLEWFKNNFTGKLLTEVKKLTFCGDDGDPIYAKDLLAILKWFNQKIFQDCSETRRKQTTFSRMMHLQMNLRQ